MANGIGCKCGAYSSNECACDVDWTPQELIDARSALAAAQEKIRKMALDALSAEGQLDEQVEELTADLARVTKERDEALANVKMLRSALSNLLHLAPAGLDCDALSHPRRYQHRDDEPCPMMKLYEDAIDAAAEALHPAIERHQKGEVE